MAKNDYIYCLLNPKKAALTPTTGSKSGWKEMSISTAQECMNSRMSACSLFTICSHCPQRETAGDCNEVIGSTRSHEAKNKRLLCHQGTFAVITSDRSTAQ